MADTSYDVIIAGGGPAGATAARVLAANGIPSLIIDKARFPRPKLCGGLLTIKTLNLVQDVFDASIDDLKRLAIFDHICDGYELNVCFEKTLISEKSAIPFYMSERDVYDTFLLHNARDAGVKIIEGDGIKKVDPDQGLVYTANGRTFKARFIIGADGYNSVVRRTLIKNKTIPARQWKNDLGTVVEAHIPRANLKQDHFDKLVISFGLINWGYAFIFPYTEKIVVGIGGLNRKNHADFMQAMRRVLTILDIPESSCERLSGLPAPFGNYRIPHVYRDRLILSGDAGGFIDPLFGEGIYFAQKTGEFAAQAIAANINTGTSIKTEYENRLRQHIYPEMDMACRIRSFCFSPVNIKLGYRPAAWLARIFGRALVETIHGVRSYRFWKKKLPNV